MIFGKMEKQPTVTLSHPDAPLVLFVLICRALFPCTGAHTGGISTVYILLNLTTVDSTTWKLVR